MHIPKVSTVHFLNETVMNHFLRFSLIALSFFLFQNLFGQNYRLVGYLPYYQFQRADEVDFEKLTHLCLAFANPDMEGNLSIGGRDIDPVVEMAHDAEVEVLLSLAGGALTAEWWAAWQHLSTAENRPEFIHKIIEYLYAHDLQGIDMDLEWQFVEDWYTDFSMELNDSLRAHDFLYTAAYPGTFRYPEISDEALSEFDFINMMVYDLTGPWDPDNAGAHSPFAFAENSIIYWRDRQGIPAENLTLGIPFYGWDFTDPNDVFSFTYRSMVNQDPSNALRDQVGAAYYNGMLTVRQKTELAIEQVSGVMIWELGQDHFDDQFSLLNVIYETLTPSVSSSDDFSKTPSLKIFPNPFSDFFTVENLGDKTVNIFLSDANGRMLFKEKIAPFSTTIVQDQTFVSGIYFLKIVDKNGVKNSKVLVKK